MAAMKAIMTTILFWMLHVAPSWGLPTIDPRDKAALTAVREAIENKEKFPAIQCSPNFYCDSSGRVIEIDLINMGLKGRIAPEIGNLTKLEVLFLWDNQLSGSIPSSIGRLEFLSLVFLFNNQLSGIIPSSIGNSASLKKIFLYNNKLSGSIPPTIGELQSLTHLWLSGNHLSGSIPLSIGKLASLEYLKIANNYFTGPVPQVNNHPPCSELVANCLFGSSLPKGCESSGQRSKKTCASFCNAIQVGGPCGGKGVCSFNTDGKTSSCACNQGYNNKARKYTCK